jgi:hypothetical protein
MIRAIILTAAALLAGCAHCQVELSASYRHRDGEVHARICR